MHVFFSSDIFSFTLNLEAPGPAFLCFLLEDIGLWCPESKDDLQVVRIML